MDFNFDDNRQIADAQMADWDAMADRKKRAAERKASVRDQVKAEKARLGRLRADPQAESGRQHPISRTPAE